MFRAARYLLLTALLLPAACAAEKPVQLSSAPPPLETGFLSPDMVEVTLRDPQPVVAAALIDPEGHAFPAGPIAHARESEAPSEGIPPQVELGASGGSGGLDTAGIGVGFPVFGSAGTARRLGDGEPLHHPHRRYGGLSRELAEVEIPPHAGKHQEQSARHRIPRPAPAGIGFPGGPICFCREFAGISSVRTLNLQYIRKTRTRQCPYRLSA